MQHTFDFTPPTSREAQEIQRWVALHNQSVSSAASKVSSLPGSLLGAVDAKETQGNAVYFLRCVLGQNLRKSVESKSSLRGRFIEALRAEISIKKTPQNPAITVRQVLLKNHSLS